MGTGIQMPQTERERPSTYPPPALHSMPQLHPPCTWSNCLQGAGARVVPVPFDLDQEGMDTM